MLSLLGDEMRHNLGVGLRAERGALLLQLLAQLAKVLDDTVVHDGESVGGMGVSVAFRRAPVSGPTGMPDADRTFERLLGEPRLEIAQLALRAPPRKLATLQGGNTGGIITAVFKSLQRVDKRAGNRLASENPHNSAHASDAPTCVRGYG